MLRVESGVESVGQSETVGCRRMSVEAPTAAVALILMPPERGGGAAGDGRMDGWELLFIVRAVNERDPWSGHVAAPGGRTEVGGGGAVETGVETAMETAVRETWEEIGVDLEAPGFACLGELPRVHVFHSRHNEAAVIDVTPVLFTSSYPASSLVFDLAPSEVDSVFAVPLTAIGEPEYCDVLHLPLPAIFAFLSRSMDPDLVQQAHLGFPGFCRIDLRAAGGRLLAGKPLATGCHLWGITLRMVAHLFDKLGLDSIWHTTRVLFPENSGAQVLLNWMLYDVVAEAAAQGKTRSEVREIVVEVTPVVTLLLSLGGLLRSRI